MPLPLTRPQRSGRSHQPNQSIEGKSNHRKADARTRRKRPRQRVPAEQISFTHSLSHARVAIIGGGVAGLACAARLAQEHRIRSTIFDTGEHGVGGRLATRSTSDGSLRPSMPPPEDWVFDHGCQYITENNSEFASQIQKWESAGVLSRWTGPVGSIQAGTFTLDSDAPGPRFVAPEGMRSLADTMRAEATATELVDMERPQWVNSMRAAESGWRLAGRNGRELDPLYDVAVIAHNGKCANRLALPAGCPGVAAQLQRLRLNSVWAVMVAFDSAPTTEWEGAFVKGSTVLSWCCNNTAKMGGGVAEVSGPSLWTLMSTAEYGKANKVPQESVPAEVADMVLADCLQHFSAALGRNGVEDLPQVLHSRCQLWGAALPVNSPGVDCMLDAVARVGVCGDWLSGASVQTAWLSGRSLGDRIAALYRSTASCSAEDEGSSYGLDARFQRLHNADIGEFPK